MAKTKKSKEEKTVDSKPKTDTLLSEISEGEKPTKISNEHLNKMQEIINNLNRGQMEIGSIETRKHAVLHHVTSFQDELARMQEELKKEYGTDNINIHTGEINHEDVKTN
jgi:L-ascorbate metabolism protein UlaG (beta-lactamase superfamily)